MPTTSSLEQTIGLAMSDITTLAALATLAIYVIYTGIFYYHWQQYSNDSRVTTTTYILYAIFTVPLALAVLILGVLI